MWILIFSKRPPSSSTLYIQGKEEPWKFFFSWKTKRFLGLTAEGEGPVSEGVFDCSGLCVSCRCNEWKREKKGGNTLHTRITLYGVCVEKRTKGKLKTEIRDRQCMGERQRGRKVYFPCFLCITSLCTGKGWESSNYSTFFLSFSLFPLSLFPLLLYSSSFCLFSNELKGRLKFASFIPCSAPADPFFLISSCLCAYQLLAS